MRFVDLIEKKADGFSLSKEEIEFMVNGFVDGSIPDYQMSSMMMAILQKDMSDQETADLTMAMMHSGDVVDLSDLPGIKLDKHSTGGVGDTTTLVVAPLVAACGGTVAKMSGRGLGHTGGTLDKLESIPGTVVEIPLERFKEIVRKCGVAVIGQSADLDPADKKMYALRDVTATVRSIPLIASSIMSKKLASGADGIVLDVKTGTGAFMRTLEESERLARTMVSIGKLTGKKVTALITDMNQPLGNAVGNALEVKEAVELLSGKIPSTDPLYEVCMLLGANMLMIAGLVDNEEDARNMLKEKIENGEGLSRLQEMITLQSGNGAYLDMDHIDELIHVSQIIDVPSRKDGYVSRMMAEKIGTAAQMLGAGRAVKEDVIDPCTGLVMKVRCGNRVRINDPLCTLYVNDDRNLNEVKELLYEAIEISDTPVQPVPMIHAIIHESDL